MVQMFLHFSIIKIYNSFNKQQRVIKPDSYQFKKKHPDGIFCRKSGVSGEGDVWQHCSETASTSQGIAEEGNVKEDKRKTGGIE